MNGERFLEVNAAAAAAASSALSRLTGRPFLVKLKKAERLQGTDGRRPALGEETSACVALDVTGGAHGAALFCLPLEAARELVSPLVARVRGAGEEPDVMDRSALKEVGNIICGSYLTVLSNELRARIIAGVPRLELGTLRSIYERAVAELPMEARQALLIEVEIERPPDRAVIGRLLLFLNTERLDGA